MAESKDNKINHTQKATEAAEDRFALLVDSVKDYGIFLLDINGFIVSWNKGAERIKGYSSSEVIGKHFSIFYLPDDVSRNHPQYELKMAIKDGRYEEEGWRLRKNGTKFWANVVITALKDSRNELIGFSKVTRDLTERKVAEEKLRKSEERFRRMFEGVKDYAMIMLNPDGTIASWNEGARRIKGYEPHEIIGKYFSIFYPEQDVQMGKCEYELREATETGRFEDEGWRVRKDKTKFWASVLITAIRDDEGNVIGFTKVTRDITDRKRADDLLKMAYANLEKRVEERTQQLIETNKKLQEAVRARDEFLSIASHELRTPLTPLKMQIQSLLKMITKQNVESISVDRAQRMAETCDKSISRLNNLLENLLDVSRINLGKMILSYETFDLTELARSIVARYENEINTSGSAVSFEATSSVLGTFDHLRIEQVFTNLLMNALKYGARKPIKIKVYSNDTHAFIVFIDKGIGIAKSEQARIFQRFERVESNVNIGGLGLGLFISQQIIEAHGGKIEVESELAEGTTFTVKIPLTRFNN